MNWLKNKEFIKNPYLYVIVIFFMAKFILFSSEFLTLIYMNIILKIFPDSNYILNLVELSSFIFITLLVVFCARKILKLPWNTLGFTRRSALIEFFKGWGLGAIILICCVIIMMIFGVVKIDRFIFDFKLAFKFIPLIIVWSIQGNAEEVLTRGFLGFLFAGCARKLNVLLAILISSLFFAMMHLGNDGIAILPLIDLFIFGVFTALVMIKTRNIWLISGFHAAWNCFQGNVFAFPVSGTNVGNAFIHITTHGPKWLSGGKFGVEGSIVSIVIQIIIVIWLCYDIFVKGKIGITDKFDINEIITND